MTIDLTECRAKIERAREHGDSLQAIINPAVSGGEPNLVQLSAKLEAQSGYHVFRVAAIQEDWRLRVGVLLGDIVHNLRSALDYLYWQLYCTYVRIPQSHREAQTLQFPIEDTSQQLANKRIHASNIPPRQWAVIENAQPYQGTDDPRRALKALRELSNRDKHQVLNPLLLRTTIVQFYDVVQATRATDFKWPHENSPHVFGSEYLEINTEIVRVRLPDEVDPEVEVAGHIAPDVQLPEWETRIMFGVGTIRNTAEGIVNDIETLI
jgi:hypothetical protein